MNDKWKPSLYDEKHAFVSSYGYDLLSLLKAKEGESVLDLGCGTGDLAYSLHKEGIHVKGVDKSENMIMQAREKFPSVDFEMQDAVSLPFINQFDAVLSNATLHWVKPPKDALQSIFNSLRRSGRFVAEFGGQGNVQQITGELIKQIRIMGYEFKRGQFPWYFPSIGQYTTLMEEVGFHVQLAFHYDRPTLLEGDYGLRNWLDMFCSDFFTDIDEIEKELIISNTENSLRSTMFKQGNWVADYKRIRFFGTKP